MCLFVKYGCKIEVAQEDITCYKIVRRRPDAYCSWASVFRWTVQPCNEVVQARDDSLGWQPVVEHLDVLSNTIHAGLHAYITMELAERAINIEEMCDNWDVYWSVIPKGAEYCLGINGDIVATQMIVFSSAEEYTKYINSQEKQEE